MDKLLVICGPTATGKTQIGVHLAQKFTGEIISADSRQVYKGMDIITGKDIDKDSKLHSQNFKLQIKEKKFNVGFRLKQDIPIWLVDIVEPDYTFNIGEYSQLARKVIADIKSRDKLPIIVGGTGLYIKSIIDPLPLIFIPPDAKLRARLEQLGKEDLADYLKKLNHQRWEAMNQSDRSNPRRLTRAIEIETYLLKQRGPSPPPGELKSDILLIGLTAPEAFLFEKIRKRITQRIRSGALDEASKLLKKGYSWKLNSFSATGLNQLKTYLEGKESLKNATGQWELAERHYAKRQLTWFKKILKINWIDITGTDYQDKIDTTIQKWYTPTRT